MRLRGSRQLSGTRIAVALALLYPSLATAHDPVRFDTGRAMAGASLTIVEVSRAATVKYRLHTVGVPRGLVVEVWANEFGHGYHQLLADLQVDESGTVVSTELDGTGRPRRLDELVFEPGPLARGAGWEVAIVGRDRKVVAYAKVIPHPIIGREGPCEVSLELASHRGERFIVSGTGFVPGEDVLTELKHSGSVIRKNRHAL